MPTTMNQNPIQRDAVILYLSVGRLRTRRKLDPSAVQSDIDPTMLHVSKEILQSSQLKAIGQHDNDLRTWIKARTLPSPFSGKGLLVLPVRLIEQFLAEIDRNVPIRHALIESFMSAYDQCKEDAREKLGSAFVEKDYPDHEAVRQTFFFEYQMWELNAPGKLKAINADLHRREVARMDNVWAEASRNVTNALLDEFRKMTSHMAERLIPDADGKNKVFRDSAVTKMQDWMTLFQERNLTHDTELDSVVERAKALISGIDASTIRDSDALRKELADGFSTLTQRLDEAIITAPVRAISLDD